MCSKNIARSSIAFCNSLLLLFDKVSLDIKTKLFLFDSMVVLFYCMDLCGVCTTIKM